MLPVLNLGPALEALPAGPRQRLYLMGWPTHAPALRDPDRALRRAIGAPQPVSLVDLELDPERWHGTYVTTHGMVGWSRATTSVGRLWLNPALCLHGGSLQATSPAAFHARLTGLVVADAQVRASHRTQHHSPGGYGQRGLFIAELVVSSIQPETPAPPGSPGSEPPRRGALLRGAFGMTLRALHLLCLVFLAGGLLIGAARADPRPAAPEGLSFQAYVDLGQRHFRAGEFDRAAAELEAALKLQQPPRLFFNLARAYHKGGRSREALTQYQRYLEAEPDSPRRAEVEAYITTLRAEISAPAPATLPPAALVAGDPPPPRRPLYKRPWFWGVLAAGTVVIGAGIATGVVLGTRSSHAATH